MKKLLLLLVIVFAASPLFSQWSTNPAVNNLVSNGPAVQKYVATCPDGAGGIITAWEENSGGSYRVFAQKTNIFGQPMWGPSGISVCNAAFDQRTPSICTDAAGGAIVYWIDYRVGGGFYDYYAQRIRTDGMLMWDAMGIKTNNWSASGAIFLHKCIAAESGSSILAWGNNSGAHHGLFSQKLDAFGARMWNPDDVLISANWNFEFDLCRDGGKGAYYCWRELDITLTHWDLFAQHVNALGLLQWSPQVTVCNENDHQYDPSMCEDQTGGFIVAWMDHRSFFYTPLTGSSDIYAAHFNPTGTNLWTSNGTAICTTFDYQYSPVCISDLHSGAHIIWNDDRNLFASGFTIYGQNIDFNGNKRWTNNGKKVADRVDFSQTADGRSNPQISGVDALGGLIACWLGYYDAGFTQYGLLTQKIDYYGVTQWDPNGVFASTGNLKAGPSMVFDGGSGGCSIAWADARNGDFDIYAQHIKSNSALGNNKPKPVYTGTKDIISQNYPNPFNPSTNIAFTLANDAKVSIAIFDMSGRQLQVLVDGFVTAGDHSVTWNASNYASGTYFYKFTNGNNVEVKKMFLVK